MNILSVFYIGSGFYFGSIAFLLALTALLWLCLRRRSQKVQHWVIVALAMINALQHLCKALIYPHYFGTGFTAVSTAYNMCATLILLSPVVILCGNRFFKNFVLFIGSFAGIVAICVPYWFVGKELSSFGWEYPRYYICHALLFITSFMPLLLRHHKASYKDFWQVGLGFLLALCIILFNDIIMMAVGRYPGADIMKFYQSMKRINPCGLMGPPESLPWVESLVKPFSPGIFIGQNKTGLYVPILWYAIPGYLGISILSFALFGILDRRNLAKDAKSLVQKLNRK